MTSQEVAFSTRCKARPWLRYLTSVAHWLSRSSTYSYVPCLLLRALLLYSYFRPLVMGTKHLARDDRLRIQILVREGALSRTQVARRTGFSIRQIRTALAHDQPDPRKRSGRPAGTTRVSEVQVLTEGTELSPGDSPAPASEPRLDSTELRTDRCPSTSSFDRQPSETQPQGTGHPAPDTTPPQPDMLFRHGLRRFATATAAVAPQAPTPYLVNLAKTQGTVKGLTGGTLFPRLARWPWRLMRTQLTNSCPSQPSATLHSSA